MSTVYHTRGDTWQRAYVIKDSALVPLDLTGATPALQIREQGGALLIDLSSYCTITPLVGRIDLEAPAAAMALPIGSYRFDLQVTFAGGRVKTYDSSTIEIVRDSTL